MSIWKKFLSAEIEIELKASLYFYTMLFFYFGYRFLSGSLSADIIIIIEMIAATYIMGFVQFFLLGNFDEEENFSWKESLKVFGCSLVYTLVSYLGGWFDRNLAVTAIYFVFMLVCYGCVYWFFSVRRSLRTKQMNIELENFKRKKLEKENG